MDIIIWVALSGALVAYTRHEAVERGRSGLGWALLAIVSAALAELVAVLVAAVMMARAGDSAAPTMLAVMLLFFSPILGTGAILLWVVSLPDGIPRVGGRRWLVHCMSTATSPGFACDLAVAGAQIHVGDRYVIAAAELTNLEADGECLRLGWAEQSLLLLPLERHGDGTTRTRMKRSLGLQRRLRKLLHRT
jgi:hypothetical protein